MATGGNTALLKVVIEATSDMKKAVKDAKALSAAYRSLNNTMKKTYSQSEKLRKSIQTTMAATASYTRIARKETETYSQTVGILSNRMRMLQNLTLGVGLSMLFGGMAIKNFFQAMWNGLFNTFMLVHGETSEQQALVNRLSGAWEYLKWSIMNALWQSGLMTGFIEGLIGIIDYVSRMPDQFKVMGAVGIVAFIGLGAVMMIAGQLALLLTGYFTVLNYVMATSGLVGVAVFNSWVFAIAMTLLQLAVVVAMLYFLSNVFTENAPTWSEYFTGLGIAIAGVGVTLKLMGFRALTAFGPIGIAIASMITLLYLARSVTDNWGDTFELTTRIILRALQHIGSFIITVALSPLIKFIDAMIWASNTLLGTSYDYLAPQAKDYVDALMGGNANQARIEDIIQGTMDRAGMGGAGATTLYSRAYMEKNPDLAITDPKGYAASIKNLQELGAPMPSNYSGSTGGVPLPQDILNMVNAGSPTDMNTYQSEIDALKAELAEMQRNSHTQNNTVTINTGAVIGDASAFTQEVKQMLERDLNYTFGSPAQ
jgi:polyhydroxyalkanoate synthesis regulator phasin